MLEQYSLSQQEVKRLQLKLEETLIENASLGARVAAAEASKHEMATKVDMAQATAKVRLTRAAARAACRPPPATRPNAFPIPIVYKYTKIHQNTPEYRTIQKYL